MRWTRAEERPPPRGGVIEAALTAAIVGLGVYVFTNPRGGAQSGRPDVSSSASGAGARSPAGIPAKGWRQILARTWREFNQDHITVIAGGVTYSVLLALFPALGAFVALYGLVADVNDIPRQIESLRAVLPSAAVSFVGGEMTRLARAQHGGLSLALGAGLLISFWSANGAMRAFFVGLNVAYEAEEKRSVVHLTLISLGFTLGMIFFLFVVSLAMAAGAATPFLGPQVGQLVSYGRWPLLVLAFVGALALLYRYGPSRPHTRWRWVSAGSIVATFLWLIASLLYSLYTAKFSHYDKTYGPLGAVVGLMIWVWLSAVIILFGAELNSEIEHQAALGKTGPKP